MVGSCGVIHTTTHEGELWGAANESHVVAIADNRLEKPRGWMDRIAVHIALLDGALWYTEFSYGALDQHGGWQLEMTFVRMCFLEYVATMQERKPPVQTFRCELDELLC